MNVKKQIDDLFDLSQKLKAKESGPTNLREKQASIIMSNFDQCVHDLIIESAPLSILHASIFYFWAVLEAPMRNVDQKKINQGIIPLDQAIQKIMMTVQQTLQSLPELEPSCDLKEFGNTMNEIKSHITDDYFERPLSNEELFFHSNHINTKIHTLTSNFLKQGFYPEIVSNVMFSRWLRLTTIHASVPEAYYQKMEHYFTEIMDAVRQCISSLFDK